MCHNRLCLLDFAHKDMRKKNQRWDCDCQLNETRLEPQFLCSSFQVLYNPTSIPFFVIFLTGINIGRPLLEHHIDQTGQLVCGGGDGFGCPQSGLLSAQISAQMFIKVLKIFLSSTGESAHKEY